ncbi:acyltransferase [Candidatus Bathyarchaeota archaeon]|nr:acyltransferase [Candidatus Bathyarchaeota archaeon]TRO46617.1 acyltransferase [Candidatus Bathyarchaeota archaeon]
MKRIVEFDWLKLIALFLLIFVHSDLYFVYPEIIYPVQWFLLGCFFFVSGFLIFDTFQKCEGSIRNLWKSKFLSLYIPFAAAAVFYFILQVAIGAVPADPLRLFSHVSLLNVFDGLNSVYNWGSLWFVPYLIAFMLIFCFTKKYVKSVKIQVLLFSIMWFCSILAWVYDTPMKLGQVFSQYFLVFMIGVWFNEFKMYERVMNFRAAYVAVPLFAVFLPSLSTLFTANNAANALTFFVYSHGRSIILSLSAILLVLLLLRKLVFPRNRFVELIAATSIIIYLMEPFCSYLLRSYVFGQTTIYFDSGTEFYLYQILRITILLFIVPLIVKAAKTTYQRQLIPLSLNSKFLNVLKNKFAKDWQPVANVKQ